MSKAFRSARTAHVSTRLQRRWETKEAAQRLFPKCPGYPRCNCPVQGYVNPRERNDCGRKPKTAPKKIYSTREQIGWE